MDKSQSTPTGWFYHHGQKSPVLRCSDVRDQFPCHTCGAGLDGNNLRCRDEAQSRKDTTALREWQTEMGRADLQHMQDALVEIHASAPAITALSTHTEGPGE